MPFSHTLLGYVVAVLIVMAIILAVMWFTRRAYVHRLLSYFLGFLLGMLAMYIAVHVYGIQ